MKAAVLKLIWKLLGRKELTINKEKCIVCGKCYKTCHHNAIEKSGNGTYVIQYIELKHQTKLNFLLSSILSDRRLHQQ